jgi:hypothetical protein
MKWFSTVACSIALLLLLCGVNARAAVSVYGDGSIGYDGTGEFMLYRFPSITVLKYQSNCTPSTIPGIVYLCAEPLDMSLLGNDIVRAEHVRIHVYLHDINSFVLGFGCPTCTTFVSVLGENLVSVPGGWGLSIPKTQALQALIDQHGASSIYMRVGLNGGPFEVYSAVQAVAMDIKPGDTSNTLNLRSRGVVPVTILTTEEFDATSIDVTSLRFGATGEEASAVRAIFNDADNDGDTDLLVFFRTEETGVDCETLFTYLSGLTFEGAKIAGTDSVNIVGCGP